MICFWILYLCTRVEAVQIYDSLSDLEELVSSEVHLINTLENQIQIEEIKLKLLKQYSKIIRNENTIATKNKQEYVSNPINAFRLIKRFIIDWNSIKTLLTLETNSKFTKEFWDTINFPSEDDLKGSVETLLNLQDIYNLDMSSIARGQLNNVKYSTELLASDCYELGRQSYIIGHNAYSDFWMNEAFNRLKKEENGFLKKIDSIKLLTFLTNVNHNHLQTKLLKTLPIHLHKLALKNDYKKQFQKDFKKGKSNESNLHLSKLYKQLCRRDVKNSSELEVLPFKCRYIIVNHIAPIKVEEIYLHPNLLLFYDFLTDKEIELLYETSRNKLHPAKILESSQRNYRKGRTAWLDSDDDKFLMRRIETVTGLNLETAEDLQICDYGVGGYYKPHADYVSANNSVLLGNRIATVLIYMTDVEQGGATVFPYLNTIVKPKKGAALFWYNLHSNGVGDILTWHGGCPVLVGRKLIATKWISEKGQEFRRPCVVDDYY